MRVALKGFLYAEVVTLLEASPEVAPPLPSSVVSEMSAVISKKVGDNFGACLGVLVDMSSASLAERSACSQSAHDHGLKDEWQVIASAVDQLSRAH